MTEPLPPWLPLSITIVFCLSLAGAVLLLTWMLFKTLVWEGVLSLSLRPKAAVVDRERGSE